MRSTRVPAVGDRGRSPFQGPGLLARAVPFAVVAVLAEASLALPPAPRSLPPVIVSLVLLLAVAAAFGLPWSRLPTWTTVLVPLAYTGSALALILAAGSTSGVGIVILIPLVWTALFHRPWESAWIVAAIVAVEVVLSLTPVAAADSVIARRVLLWASLGALLSVATHGLRDRIGRAQEERERLQARLRDLSVMEDRDRIAVGLRDKVIQRIFAAGLTMQGAATLTADPEVRRRVEVSVQDLDQAVRMLRDAIFGLERRLDARGLRQEILDLCGGLSPAPEVSFAEPVEGALSAATRAEMIDTLREALGVIGGQAIPARVGIAAEGDAYLTVIEAEHMPTTPDRPGWEVSGLRDRATRDGVRIDIEPIPGGTRFAWRFPAGPGKPRLA
jgi:signal transduction histidine kinase